MITPFTIFLLLNIPTLILFYRLFKVFSLACSAIMSLYIIFLIILIHTTHIKLDDYLFATSLSHLTLLWQLLWIPLAFLTTSISIWFLLGVLIGCFL